MLAALAGGEGSTHAMSAAAQQEDRRLVAAAVQAASCIQRCWRCFFARRARRLNAAVPPQRSSPYEQLRDLLVKYPQLQNGMYAAAASDVSRPWMRSMVGDSTEHPFSLSGPQQHLQRPRRQAARASLRKLERWLLHDSATREELLELLSDHELWRIALLRELEACSSEGRSSTLPAGLDGHRNAAGRAGAADLQEARAAERSAVNDADMIRQRVRERSVKLSVSASAPTTSLRQRTTPPQQRIDSECVAQAWTENSAGAVDAQAAGQTESPRTCAPGGGKDITPSITPSIILFHGSGKGVRSSHSPPSQVTDYPMAARRGKKPAYGLKRSGTLAGSGSRSHQGQRRPRQGHRINDFPSNGAHCRPASADTIVQQAKLDAILHRRSTTFAAA